MDLVHFLCTSVFLVSIYTIQIALFVVQPGSVVHWRTSDGLPPATALRRWTVMYDDFTLIWFRHNGPVAKTIMLTDLTLVWMVQV